MKEAIIAILSLTFLSAWSLQEVTESEGTQTHIILCNNEDTKVIYYSHKGGKYEITPSLKFDTLDEAAKYVCKE